MKELADTLETGCALKDLGHAGFIVNFGAVRFKTLKLDGTTVVFDNIRYQEYWSLVFNVVRSRASSMRHHVLGLPEVTAGLLHEEEAHRNATWLHFKCMVEAFRAAQTQHNPTTQKMVTISPFPHDAHAVGVEVR